jgi:hypothetical protein
VPLERFHRTRRVAAARSTEHLPPTLVREVGILLRAGERELLGDDALSQDEPGVIVTLVPEMRERAERVETGKEWRWKSAPTSVEPDGGRSGQNTKYRRTRS